MKISFSVITVTYNSKKALLETINSVQSQKYKNFTHIIKDGFSEDKTREINFSKYKNTLFYESKDNGIYDAMNQAIKYAPNEYIIYLNSGDTFFSENTMQKIAEIILNNPGYYSYCGGTLQIDPLKKKFKRIIGIGKSYRYLPFAQLPHPSLVVKKSILNKLKYPFDSRLKIAADYKQQLVLRKKNLWKIHNFHEIVSIMPIGGISNKNRLSILEGYKETLIFSFKLFNFVSFYIILLKIFLNFYSRISVKKSNKKLKNYNIFKNYN